MWIIHVDILRTTRHIHFLPPLDPPEGAADDINGSFVVHMRRIERILYVFGSQNSLRYHQGFNELIVPLYYANYAALRYFDQDPDIAEAITFHCFQSLLTKTEISSYYAAHQDSSVLDSKMDFFRELMRRHLPNVQKTLDYLDVSPIMFSMRWFGLLFGQEYQMPVLLIVWDALLAHVGELMGYVAYIAVSRVKMIAGRISVQDFPGTMNALQEPMSGNVYVMLKDALTMYEADQAPQKNARRPIAAFFKGLF
jgi:hypothetical protein